MLFSQAVDQVESTILVMDLMSKSLDASKEAKINITKKRLSSKDVKKSSFDQTKLIKFVDLLKTSYEDIIAKIDEPLRFDALYFSILNVKDILKTSLEVINKSLKKQKELSADEKQSINQKTEELIKQLELVGLENEQDQSVALYMILDFFDFYEQNSFKYFTKEEEDEYNRHSIFAFEIIMEFIENLTDYHSFLTDVCITESNKTMTSYLRSRIGDRSYNEQFVIDAYNILGESALAFFKDEKWKGIAVAYSALKVFKKDFEERERK